MWCRTGFTNLIRVKVKVKEKKILKVGKKRKKDKKHTKLDCQDSSSRSLPAVGFACLKLHHAAKKTKYKTHSISEYYVRNNHAIHRLEKKHFSHGFKRKWDVKKVTLIVQISFAEKNYSRRECDLHSMADFRDVVSVLRAARLIRQVESLLLKKKLIDREKSRSLS